MNWEIIVAIIGAVGGSAGIVELARYLANRKADGRVADAHADTEEFHALKEYNEFLQQRLQEKEERFTEQTLVVRELNKGMLSMEREISGLKLQLEKERCALHLCPWREPPNALTPPPPGEEKDEWHRKRKREEAKA